MTLKKSPAKKQHCNYYSPIDRRMTEFDRQRGLGLGTPLGIRYHDRNWPSHIASLQGGDKAQLRRSGMYPRETVNAVFIDPQGTLYDAFYRRCSRTCMRTSIQTAVSEWYRVHGVTR